MIETSLVLLTLVGIITVGILLALVVWKRRKTEEIQEPNYRAFFIMGISFLPIGITFMIISFVSDISFVIGVPLFALGATYLSIGLANRDKWDEKQ